MISVPHPIAAEAFRKYIMLNPGDPGSCPQLMRLEKDCISWMIRLFSTNNNENKTGFIVSGGTEANLLAVLNARKITKGKKIIIPTTAHASLDKIADIMNLKIVKIPVDSSYKMRTDSLKKELKKGNIAVVVAVAGNTGLGQFDPIPEIADICSHHEIPLHVDAAFAGMLTPFLNNELKKEIPNFDFTIPGVSSIAVNPHKMGMVPPPCGVVLFREHCYINYKIHYLSGGNTCHHTLLGTRPGGSVAALWAMIHKFGIQNYRKTAKKVMELTAYANKGLLEIESISNVISPVINVIPIRASKTNAAELQKKMKSRGWLVGRGKDYLRIVIMPHHNRKLIDLFINDIEGVLK